MKVRNQSAANKAGARHLAALFRKAGVKARVGGKLRLGEISLKIVKTTFAPNQLWFKWLGQRLRRRKK